MSNLYEKYDDGTVVITEAGVCDIYEIGEWYTYLDGDEDIVYTVDKNANHPYSDDYVALLIERESIGYSIGHPKNITQGAKSDSLYEKEYVIEDFAVSASGDEAIRLARLLIEYVTRRASSYGCDRIVIEKRLPEFTVFYSFIESFGAAFCDGRYIIELPNTDKRRYKYALPIIDGQLTREVSYRLIAMGFTLGEQYATHPLLGGEIRIDRLTGDVCFDNVGIATPEGLNANEDRDLALILYLISNASENDAYQYRKALPLHGEPVYAVDITWGEGYAGIILYDEEPRGEGRGHITYRLTNEYSTSIHALYKAGYSTVMIFTATYDEERESFSQSSTMVDTFGGLKYAVDSQMTRIFESDNPRTLAERRAARRMFDSPTKIRLDFGNKSAWFIIDDGNIRLKLDGREIILPADALKNIKNTLDLISLSNWKKKYEGDGESWTLAIKFRNGASFISEGKGEYPPSFPIALDLYYDFTEY